LHHDVSPPLRDLGKNPRVLQPGPAEAEDLKVIPLPSGFKPAGEPDRVLQSAVVQKTAELAPTILSPTVGLNFEGLGSAFPNYTVNVAPPDTNGAVGRTQYVQWVNLSFAVFDKVSGKVTLGPLPGNTLWTGFGGSCETDNNGDPIVTYDKLADRWVFSQLVFNQPFMQCIAVSTSSDATGTYNRYAFEFSGLDDYPKMGVWPDAYYETFNIFIAGTVFVGADACAYDRNAMLNGQPAAQVCFQQASNVGSLLPADLDGHEAPPAGSPNFMMDFDVNSLNLYKFHVDFTTPANSTFTGPVNIPVAPFTPFCQQVRGCVPQPGGDGTLLDSLGDRLMYRLAYRNFGDHESLVVNHSVLADSVSQNSGIRWYEIQNPNGAAPTVAQQSTFAPDPGFRWMGSIAMDVNGDLAVGYSVANSTSVPPVFPSIAFATRASSDPPSTLQAETSLVSGAGSQTGGLTRWGDYSAMQVDPQDDCTFWYTSEYLQNSGSFNWNTRIANFKFPGCGITDLRITNSHIGKFTQGQTGSYTITVANIGGQPTDGTAVTVTDVLPTGLTASAISSTDTTWVCNPGTLSCTRSDVLAPGSAYPAITVTVNIAADAPGLLTNTATVSGGGDKNPSNNTASDPTTIIVTGPDPAIAKVHVPLVQSQSGTYTITVTNLGLSPTDPTKPLTVTDTLPTGLTATAIGSTDPLWVCALATLTCTRSDTLASNQSYPPITVSVNIAANAPLVVVNTASVAGGGDTNPFNNTTNDPAAVLTTPPGLAITSPVPPAATSGATEFKPGTQIPIVGTATGPSFQDFRLEWAEGINPATGWSSSGMTLAGGGSTPVTNGALGTWDTSAITQADYYTIRLSVDDAGFTNFVVTLVYLEPSLLSVHWPVTLKVAPDLDSGFLPAVDASGNQRLALVAPIYLTSEAIPAQYFSFAPDNSSQTVTNITQPSYLNPAVGNVEGIPGEDVVIPDINGGQGQMQFFRADNTSFNFQLPSGSSSYVFNFDQPVLEDVGGTGQLNVVSLANSFSRGFGVDPARLFAWQPDGSMLGPNFPISVPDLSVNLQLNFKPRVFIADLQGDGNKEFIVEAGLSSSTFTLQLFAHDGSPLTWAVPVFNGWPPDLALADLDHNGKLETLLLVTDGLQTQLHVFQPDGSERPGFPVGVGGSSQAHIAVGDLNRDGTEEIVVLVRNNSLIVLEPDGTPFPGAWPQVALGNFLAGPIALADVDGDGFPEILLTAYHLVVPSNSAVPAVSSGEEGRATVQTTRSPEGLVSLASTTLTPSSQEGASQYWATSLIAVRRDATIARSWNLPGADGNQPFSEAKITVGDFDQDGITDIAIVNFTIGGGGISGFLTGGVAQALTTGAKFNGEANDWPMLHHDPHNTAVLHRDVTISLSSPANGANVSMTVPVTATTTGPVASVQFELDGMNLGSPVTVAPFTVLWDTTQTTGGIHKLAALATDTNGRPVASAPISVNVEGPVLTIAKSHTGAFTQGQTGATYTLTVSNVGSGSTTGVVTVTDVAPTGLTATAISGTGWTCPTLSSCNRSDALAPGSSYPAITLTVNVASNARALVTNSASVSGGRSPRANATDPTTIIQLPDLSIAKAHAGNFTQGQTGATYTLTVSNVGSASTTGLVTVTDVAPTGLTATAISGTGWTCPTLSSCNRSDALAAGSSYPAITLTVNVANNAPASVTNSASVSGGGSPGANATDPTTIIQLPDLSIAKAHAGSFTQGQTGATYTLTVSNVGSGSTTGVVTVTDVAPSGLTATAISGTGWTCPTLSSCNRSDALTPGSSYPAITLTVNVANDAEASVTNSASVSGGGSPGANATDPTTIIQLPDLTIAKAHAGNFTQGQTGATYTLTVSNVGSGSTTGLVTVTDVAPTGLTATAISGSGWTCPTLSSCNRSDALAPGSSYPAITLTVNVANNAAASVTNSASVSGGGEINTANDTTTDPTTVNLLPDVVITASHNGNFTQGQIGATYTIVVSNTGGSPTTATVGVADTLPPGLTATAINGVGWTCPTLTSCTRSDALASGASYPAITLTVSVSLSAPASVTNMATVSGGGEVNAVNDTATDPTTITLLSGPPLTVSVSGANDQTVNEGGTATYLFNVTSLSSQLTGIQLTCAGLPPLSSCSFSPQSFGGLSTPVTLTITTTANTASALPPGIRNSKPLLAVLLLPFFGLAPLVLGKKRQNRFHLRLVYMLPLIALLIALVSCGGHASAGGNNGTPPGTYQISVTATSTAVTPPVQANTNVNLIVK
jgi:uncharacterized repeat protein (TIGR01451 family)